MPICALELVQFTADRVYIAPDVLRHDVVAGQTFVQEEGAGRGEVEREAVIAIGLHAFDHVQRRARGRNPSGIDS